MIASYRYEGRSAIANGLRDARVGLATNTLREATFFRGTLAQPVLFREGLATLHGVVVSDYKYRPRDRFAFQSWLAEQDRLFLANLALGKQAHRERIEQLEARLGELDRLRQTRRKPFHEARLRYIDYIYTNEYEQWMVLDPVITVHPDEVAFEAFSKDESTYARLGAKGELFDRIDEFECGTTNIDFSTRLHGELERMRSYRTTRFDIGPSGFGVAVGGGPSHVEKKIDLPESWVRGFHQVQSVMTLGLTRFRMTPVDLHNIVGFLRRHKAKTSPRALRYELEPGRPTRVVFEPWNHVLELSPASTYEGAKPQIVRTWGRTRLQTLDRLIPSCRVVDVYLAGFGLPTIYVLDLGPLQFTLALSGWTDNDWTGGASAQFDLLSRRLDTGPTEVMRVYEAIRQARRGTAAEVAATTGLGVEAVRSAFAFLCRSGRAMYDLAGGVYRHRDLFPEPFTAAEAAQAAQPPALLPAPSNAQGSSKMKAQAVPADTAEAHAAAIHEAGHVQVIARRPVSDGFKLSGSARGASGPRVRPLLHVDHEGRIITGSCTCHFFEKHQLTRGPCEHILALRLAHMARLAQEDAHGAV